MKIASRARSDVGRVFWPEGAAIVLPLKVPLIILMRAVMARRRFERNRSGICALPQVMRWGRCKGAA